MKDTLIEFVDGRGLFKFEIKLSDNRRIDKDTGYLYCDNAIFGHTGPQDYYAHELNMGEGLDANRVVTVHRFAEDVFTDEVMASYEGKSVTREHPSEKVTKSNVKMYDVGTILRVWKDEDNVKGNIVIKDMETIEDILDGKMSALSLGYKANIVKLDNGEFKQTDIHINHLAVVKQGRAKNARILDSKPEKEKKSMKLFDWLKGSKIKLNDDETITIMDNEKEDVDVNDAKYIRESKTVIDETNEYDDETGETKNARTTVETTSSKTEKNENKSLTDEKKEEIENKEGEKNVMTKEEMQLLRDELKAELQEQNKLELDKMRTEFKKTVFDDVKVVETTLEDGEKDKEQLKLDFAKDEKLRKMFWNAYTNPTAHASFKEFNAFREKANKASVM